MSTKNNLHIEKSHYLTSQKLSIINEPKIIFLNPKKLKVSENKTTKCISSVTSKLTKTKMLSNQSTQKVYINPNFKKISETKDPSIKVSKFCFVKENSSCNNNSNVKYASHQSKLLGVGTYTLNNQDFNKPFTTNSKLTKYKTSLVKPYFKTAQNCEKLKIGQTNKIVCSDIAINFDKQFDISKGCVENIKGDKCFNITGFDSQTSLFTKGKKFRRDISSSSKYFSDVLNINKNIPSQSQHQVSLKTKHSYTTSHLPSTSKIYITREKLKSNFSETDIIPVEPITRKEIEMNKNSTMLSSTYFPMKNLNLTENLLTKKSDESNNIKMIPFVNEESTNKLFTKNNLLKEHSNLINQNFQIKSNIVRQRRRSSNSNNSYLISLSKTKMVRKNKCLMKNISLENEKNGTGLKQSNVLNFKKHNGLSCYGNISKVKRVFRYHNQSMQLCKTSKVRQKKPFINNLVKLNFCNQRNKSFDSTQPKSGIRKSKYNKINKINKNTTNISNNNKKKKKNVKAEIKASNCRNQERNCNFLNVKPPIKLINQKALTKENSSTKIFASKYGLRVNKISDDFMGKNVKMKTDNIFSKNKMTFQKNRSTSLGLVNIGGVFYKTSRNKLTRKNAISKKGPVLQIRGQRFLLDKSGHTLEILDRTSLGKKNNLKRVDLGGMTFKLSQQGTSLVRTNTHTTRTRLIQAKQRSIALLTNKFKKNNQLCLIFNQFGRCAGKENGTCCKIHNLQNISICQRFVQGKCQNSSCLLSHEISPEKMPTCYHYLAGNCVRDNCPYLHVKVNSHAPVCTAFLDGFCIDGENCKKRHTNICPDFERKGVCSKGKYCPHPHPKKRKTPKNKKKEVETNNDEIKSYQEVSTFRYFDQNQHQEKQGENKTNEYNRNSNISTNDEESVKVFRKRPNLGVLPAFIPLNFD